MSDVRCQMSDVRCQVSGVRCQMSDVRCQVSGVRCQVSGVRCQKQKKMNKYLFFPIILFLISCSPKETDKSKQSPPIDKSKTSVTNQIVSNEKQKIIPPKNKIPAYEIVENSLAFNELIQKIKSVKYGERKEKWPVLCVQAANLATNIQQRYLALKYLAWLYCDNSDIVNCRKIIEKILGNEVPPYKSWRRIFCLQRNTGDITGATNLLARMVESETNINLIITISLYGATITKEINEAAINQLIKKFPSNGNMYVKIADLFKKHEWYDNEIKYRKTAVKFLINNDQKNTQINILINRYLEFNEIGNAEKLLLKYKNVLSSNEGYTVGMSKIYIASGRTNDAFDLLIKNCEDLTPGKESIINKLLVFNWPEKEQHIKAATIAQAFIDHFPKNKKSLPPNHIYQLLIKKYIFTGQSENALQLCKEIFSQGRSTSLFPTVCKLIGAPDRIEKLIKEMLSLGVTQTHFYAAAAKVCNAASLPELASELYFKVGKASGNCNYLRTALRLAIKTSNYDLCEKIIDIVIRKFKAGTITYYEVRNINEILKNVNIKNKEELKLLIANSKESKKDILINNIFEEYKKNRNINEICSLIKNHLDHGEMNLDTVLELSGKYYRIRDENGMKAIMNLVEKQMTNSQMISENGTYLLCQMSMLNDKNKSLDLAEKWFDDTNISIDIKDQILGNFAWAEPDERLIKLTKKLYSGVSNSFWKSIGNSRLRNLYMEAGDVDKFKKICNEIINDPKTSINYIAYQYEKMNLNEDALMLYDRALEKLSESDPKRLGILNKQAKLYIKLGNPNAAILCAKQCVAARPENTYTHSLLAETYKSAGRYKNAVDELCKSIKMSNEDWEQQNGYNKLIDLIQTTDVKFDVPSFANSLLEENRSEQNLLIAAGLYAADDKINNLESLFKEALDQTEDDSGKAKIYKEWLGIVKKSGDEKLTDKTLRDYYNIANAEAKGNIARQIVEYAVNAGNYEVTIKDGEKFLAELKSESENHWATAHIQKNIARAYLESGDSDNAWKSINIFAEYSLKNNNDARWNTYINFANQLGKEEEALGFMEKAYDKSYSSQKNYIMPLLLTLYKNTDRNADIQKLVEDADEQLKHSAHYGKIDIADFYVEAGENDKALNVLKNVYNDSRKHERNEHFRKIYDIYKKENRLDEALEWANQQPECAEIDGMKAEIIAETGDYDKAIELYSKAMNNMHIEKYRKEFYKKRLVETAVKTGDKEKVVNKLVKKIKNDNKGNLRNELQQLAEIFQMAEMYDEALRSIKRAESLTRNKDEIEKLDNRKAECLAKTGEYDDAVKVYEKILQDDSMKWEEQLAYQNKIAETYKNAHRSDEAKETAEDIVKTCKEFLREHEYGTRAMNARFALAEAYQNSGDKEEARDILERIQKKYKNTSYAKRAEEKLKKIH